MYPKGFGKIYGCSGGFFLQKSLATLIFDQDQAGPLYRTDCRQQPTSATINAARSLGGAANETQE